MDKMQTKYKKIIQILLRKESLKSSEIHRALTEAGGETSLVTIKRFLTALTKQDIVTKIGSGPATRYHISHLGRLFADIDTQEYMNIEPDKRHGLNSYNFGLLQAIPPDIFTDTEAHMFETATAEYKKRIVDLPVSIQKKELERLVIELSWKSSRIEGNTYTLLDTERLILEHKEAPGHPQQEARMILNHKDAFDYIRENAERFRALTHKNLEDLHAILVKDLGIGTGLRSRAIGVTGSTYRPLDNIHQINEAIGDLTEAVSRSSTPYGKALVALLGISYIQPFEDGNKRTGRLMANALLLAHGRAPLSYRSVDENEYREAMLVFYELNSLEPFKGIFVQQYEFAARNYAAV